jgi:hypothetical protein
MALQPRLGILAERQHRNDSLDCIDSPAAWVCLEKDNPSGKTDAAKRFALSDDSIRPRERGWMDLKSAATGDDRSIITEAGRGEDSSVKNCEEALKKILSPDVFCFG